jgi:phage gp45-like
VGKRQEFTGSHLELTTNGHLVFVSKEYMKIESLSTLNMTIDGAVTETFGSTQNTTVSGAISVNGSSTIGVTASGAVTINGSTINLN